MIFSSGNARFSLRVDPETGGYVLRAQDSNKPSHAATLAFQTPAELAGLLSEPANEDFLLLVVGILTPASTKTVRQFIDTVAEKLRVNVPASQASTPGSELMLEGAGIRLIIPKLPIALDPERYYFVSLGENGRSVDPQLGSLLKEQAQVIGRMTGTAEKSPANRHEINVLTGAQVLAEGLSLV